MFETTMEKIFFKKSEQTALLNLIKEDPNSSKKLKMDVLKALEPKGYLSNLGASLDEKLSPNFKIALAMVVEICLASLGLFLIFVQETKDILTILSIHTFHQDVIQGRIHLIDNLPLMEFVAILSVIYGFTFLIKLLSAVTNAGSTPNGEAHSCHINIFNWRLNPHWIPFVAEIVIGFQYIQQIVRNFKSKLAMYKVIDNLDDNREEQIKAWNKIVDIAQGIEYVDLQRETLTGKRKKIKIVSCLQAVQKDS